MSSPSSGVQPAEVLADAPRPPGAARSSAPAPRSATCRRATSSSAARSPAHSSCDAFLLLELAAAADVRDQPLRPQDHDRDEGGAVDRAAGTPRTRAAAPAGRSGPARPRPRRGCCPCRPRITIASAVIETMTSKLAGVSEPIFTANSAPPSEPTAPPIANASSLNRVVLMPIASATCSSSRIAFQARPIRELASRHETKIASRRRTRARGSRSAADRPEREAGRSRRR